jgi:hypothetical protein
MEFWPFWTSSAGLVAGAGMGLYALVNPRWAARIVRLRDDPDLPGGFAEFRGTYGGLFAGAHLFALVFMVAVAREIEAIAGMPTHWTALGAAGACGVMWWGTAVGRVAAMAFDGAGTRYNQGSVIFEVLIGLLILAPWLAPWFAHG